MKNFERVFRFIRATAFIIVALLLINSLAGLIVRAQNGPTNVVDTLTTEHRITTLETKVDWIIVQMNDLNKYLFGLVVGTAGLCGEAGLRLVRRKPPGA